MSMSTALSNTALTRLPSLKFEEGRIIIGAFVQYIDNRGGWLRHDGKVPLPKDREYLGLATRRALQRFVERIPEIITVGPDEELPDVDELNQEIPRDQWPIGLNGEREPPWHKEFVAYMLDVRDLSHTATIQSARAVA